MEQNQMMFIKPPMLGAAAVALMLVVYFGVVGLISGMDFARKFQWFLQGASNGK